MTHRAMELITHEDLLDFRREVEEIEIEKVRVLLKGPFRVKTVGPPEDYVPETETVWSFPNRGDWATHRGNYRGNWSPYIPRNLILRYSAEGDVVLDQMCGSGTTLVECRLLGRRGIGVDINRDAIMVTRDRLDFDYAPSFSMPPALPVDTYVGDARNLNLIDSNNIDLIATHPPYAGIIGYSNRRVEGDLSALKLEAYLDEMRIAAGEALRVLKPGAHCGVLIGDTRKHLHYIPISQRVMHVLLEVGFLLREDII
ncbi:MAG: TRM11 family SAM-dependent methyltransferase, partial [Dehalococcoidia bacterium]